MDINAIIKENLPEGVEMSDRAVSMMAKAIKQVQGEEFVPKTAYAKPTEKTIALQSKVSALSGASADSATYQSQLDALVQQIITSKTDHKPALDAHLK